MKVFIVLAAAAALASKYMLLIYLRLNKKNVTYLPF